MKKILNNKYFYLLSLINASYFTYLICRLHNYNWPSILVIFIVNITIFLLFSFFVKKNINLRKISKKTNKKIVIISCIASLVVLIGGWSFFTNTFQNVTLDFDLSKTKLEDDSFINNIVIDNIKYQKTEDGYQNNLELEINKDINYQSNFKKHQHINIYIKILIVL